MDAALQKMRAEDLSDTALHTFAHQLRRLREGESGVVPETEIEPLGDVAGLAELAPAGPEALDGTVVLKLNGGLGTSMGMTRAKSLLEVKNGLTFLDLIVRQVLALREGAAARLPLLLMNSFRTREDTLAALERYPSLEADLPPDFLQGRVPKLGADDLEPVEWPADPEHEWAPPGHGDLYTSLLASGLLDTMLKRGYRTAFVSNSDNLGAIADGRIAAWFEREGLPFAMEVCDRTEGDRKGGHPARRREGGLLLRETAQVAEEDQQAFEDVERHRYFNTNNLWVNLRALAETLEENDGVMDLPLIVNRKTVDPADPSSPEVLQLETAMGAAVGAFEGAGVLHVPRARFVPVKTTNELLLLRSDAYVLGDGARVELSAECGGRIPLVELDKDYFRLLDEFEQRFPHGPPSLKGCDALTVKGDVTFGRRVVVRGMVTVEGPRRIEDGTLLEA
jgi:UTP--glucose-1-phosphate uridylyltransferase